MEADVDVDGTASAMLAACIAEEQCARRIADDATADGVRARLRALAREQRVRIRTARLRDTVVVVRLDAAVWQDDAATMRSKLAPSG